MKDNTLEKDFQKYSADAIYENLFGKNRSGDYFLLADEVGLGKTVITKNLVKRLIDNRKDRKIHVYYVCNNLTLAGQNRERLVPEELKNRHHDWDEKFLVKADRLSLLHGMSDDHEESRLKIYSLTPQTSLREDRMRGNRHEKELLYNILSYQKGNDFREFLQAFFRGWLKSSLSDNISIAQLKVLKSALERVELPGKKGGSNNDTVTVKSLLQQVYDQWYRPLRKVEKGLLKKDGDPWQLSPMFDHRLIHEWRYRVIKRLVKELALLNFDRSLGTSAGVIRLVVLDEFQRFDEILELKRGNGDGEKSIAGEMFRDNRVLIVSATPYRAYSEKPNQHYEEFEKVLRFLFDGCQKGDADGTVTRVREKLNYYHGLLSGYFNTGVDERDGLRQRILDVKNDIENILRSVMIRTERYHFIRDKDKGIDTFPKSVTGVSITGPAVDDSREILKRSLREFYWVSQKEMLGNSAIVQSFWKSGDKLLNFVDPGSYKTMGRMFRSTSGGKMKLHPGSERHILDALRNNGELLLEEKQLDSMEPLPVDNEKMNYLLKEFMPGDDSGRFLWVAPSYRYYDDDFYEMAKGKPRKVLIFSAWGFVPGYVAAVASYHNSVALFKALQKIDPLRFKNVKALSNTNKILIAGKQFKPSRVLYPSYFLSSIPLPSPEPGLNREEYITQCREKILEYLLYCQERGRVKLSTAKEPKGLLSTKLAQLDYIFLDDMLNFPDADTIARGLIDAILPGDGDISKKNDLQSHYDSNEVLREIDSAPVIYPGEVDQLAAMMVGSPAVCVARSLLKGELRELVVNTDDGNPLLSEEYGNLFYKKLKNFFQNREHNIIASYDDHDSYMKSGSFIDRIVDYCVRAHFAAVCDEYVFMLRQEVGQLSTRERLQHCIEGISGVLGLHSGRSQVRLYQASRGGKTITVKNKIMPGDVALPFVENIQYDDGTGFDQPLRTTTIRKTFNSPFYPFILASTSTGQEGLDFHYYCMDIMHWNLPGSPVDLEQREGRINRYNGLLVRRNIARWVMERGNMLREYHDVFQDRNTWDILFHIVDEKYNGVERYNRGLFPHWLFMPEGGEKLRRHVPIQTMSQDKLRFNRLIEFLAYYRLALGQARQDDFINRVLNTSSGAGDLRDELNEFTINLSPDTTDRYIRDYVGRELLGYPDRVKKLISQVREVMKTVESTEIKKEVVSFIESIENMEHTTRDSRLQDYLERLFYFVNPFDRVPDHLAHGLQDDYHVLKNGLSIGSE